MPLVEVADAGRRAPADPSGRRGQLPQHHPQQRCLAAPVGAEDGQALPGPQLQRKVVEQQAAAQPQADRLQRQDPVAAQGCAGQLDAHRVPLEGLDGPHRLHLGQPAPLHRQSPPHQAGGLVADVAAVDPPGACLRRLPALLGGLHGLRPLPVLPRPLFQPLHGAGPLLVGGPGALPLQGPLGLEGRVPARIGPQAPVLQVEDAGHAGVQEGPVVGHEQERAARAGQVALQPNPRRRVEVFGGFIQQQHVRVIHQRPGQRGPDPLRPAARQAPWPAPGPGAGAGAPWLPVLRRAP